MQLMTAMVGKLELSTEPLPQDLTEGVEEDEWVSLLSLCLSLSLSVVCLSLCLKQENEKISNKRISLKKMDELFLNMDHSSMQCNCFC